MKIKIHPRITVSPNRLFAAFSLLTLILVSQTGLLLAQTVLQGYASDEQLQRGMLVAVKEGDESTVVALTDKNAQNMKGIVVEQNDSPVTLSSEERKIFVATSGVYDVLVSNEGGKIKKGDLLSVSSLAGIATKAGDNQLFVVGRASADFDGGGDAIGSSTTSGGKTVQMGRIPMDISLGKNPSVKIPEKDRVPDSLQRLGNAIADRPVNAIRLYVGLFVFAVTSIIAGMMLYSGTRSSLIAIGRNPLSKASIYRGLIQVVLMSLIVFIIGLFGVYLLLKL